MDAWRVVEILGAVVIGAILTPLTQFLLSRLNEKQQRNRVIFQREQERIADLRAVAGHLADTLASTSYGTWKRSEKVYNECWPTLDSLKGYFLHHRELHDAIGKLVGSAAEVVTQFNPEDHAGAKEKQASLKELRTNYDTLMKACDHYLKTLRI